MADIFVSYARSDRARVEPLVTLLEEQGWSVWWDREIGPGSAFREVIEREIEAARCVIVVWTPASVTSDWVNAEANEALTRKVLIPVMLEQTQLPLVFRQMQCCDLQGWPDRADPQETMRLLQATADVLQRPVVAPPEARRRPRVLAFAGLLGILVVIGAAAFHLLVREDESTAPIGAAPSPTTATTQTSGPETARAPRLLLQPFRGMPRDISHEVGERLLRTGALQLVPPEAAGVAGANLDARIQGAQTGTVLTVSVFDVATQRTLTSFRVDTQSTGLEGAVDEVARRIAQAFGLAMEASRRVISEEGYLAFLTLRAELRESPATERRRELLAALEALMREHPRFAEGFAALCDAYVNDFRMNANVTAFEEAEGHCNRAMRLDMGNPWVEISMGNLYRSAGQLEEAAASYEAALEQSPYLTAARVGLARVAADDGDLDQARRLLDTALDQEPYSWGIHSVAANTYFAANRYREAAEFFEEAVRLSNGNASMLSDLGSAYFMLGEESRPIENWERSVALEPTPAALTNLGSSYYFAGDFDAAVAAYEEAARMQASDYRLWINTGEAAVHSPGLDHTPYFERAVELAS